MISVEIGKIGGQTLTFHQVNGIEEAKTLGLPDGSYFWWEIAGKEQKIFDASVIIGIVQDAVAGGDYAPQRMAREYGGFYKALVETQTRKSVDALMAIRDKYKAAGVPDQYVKIIEDDIKRYERVVVAPDEDGMFRPRSIEEIKAVAEDGSEMFYDEKTIQAIIGANNDERQRNQP
ncbi:MAG TPA: hypothetical protein PKM65_20200 [Spirochaetota bacterium]|nr:hypothetical protein [Spirochaetota bacterium]